MDDSSIGKRNVWNFGRILVQVKDNENKNSQNATIKLKPRDMIPGQGNGVSTEYDSAKCRDCCGKRAGREIARPKRPADIRPNGSTSNDFTEASWYSSTPPLFGRGLG